MDVVVSLSQGLSPRGRGNLSQYYRYDLYDGSIPAWAGEPRIWP